MKKITAVLPVVLCFSIVYSCQDNKAAATKAQSSNRPENKSKENSATDAPSIAAIETDTYVLKVHRAFSYQPKENIVLANTQPKEGHKLIFLDISLRNKGQQKLDGGLLFVGLKAINEKGIEYKKPAAALAAYLTDHPGEQDEDEYKALWESFAPNEFHRAVFCAVEVPEHAGRFTISIPSTAKNKERKQTEVSF